jgi:hypothetical protein
MCWLPEQSLKIFWSIGILNFPIIGYLFRSPSALT